MSVRRWVVSVGDKQWLTDAGEIRRKLSASSRCYPECPGWAVFNGREIQACDACSPAELTDEDLARLPEAQAALAQVAVAALATADADEHAAKREIIRRVEALLHESRQAMHRGTRAALAAAAEAMSNAWHRGEWR